MENTMLSSYLNFYRSLIPWVPSIQVEAINKKGLINYAQTS